MSSPSNLYWSVRRELWENRSIYMAPLIVAAVALFGFMINTLHLARKMRAVEALDAASQRTAVATPYSLAAAVILFFGIVVGFFYCLDALNSERRDRSILFWKSLPVSDLTTVLSKASIPMVVQPLIGYLIALTAQFIMLILSTAVLLASGVGAATLWTRLPLVQMPLVMLYGLAVHALWFAPIYGWLLLVSAWAKRAVFLWATLPFFLAFVVEKLAFGTTHLPSMLRYRFMGAMVEAFAVDASKSPITRLSQLDPLTFLTSAGLWIGLIFAAAFLTAAVRLRRNREPI